MKQQLYFNGIIIPMINKNTAFDSVLVTDGVITAVGDEKTLSVFSPLAERIDLKQHTMLPGFIDGHSHLSAAAIGLSTVNLSPPPAGKCKSINDIISALKHSLNSLPLESGRWLIGMGYDNSALENGIHPTKSDLDKVSRDIPIIITHVSGHLAVVNSKAMEIMGYSTKNPSIPDGGQVTEDGLLKETAFFSPEKQALIKGASFEDSLKNMSKACALYASYGITTAQDARVDFNEYALLNKAGEENYLTLDAAMYMTVPCAEKHLDKRYPAKNQYKNNCRPAGCKIFLDGSPQGKTAWLSKPYLIPPEGKDEDYCGMNILNDSQLLDILEKCVKNHWQVNAHANGDMAIEQFIQCYDKICQKYSEGKVLRPVIIHCQTVREDQLDRMKKLGILSSFFLDHVFYWGDYHINSVLGIERAENISPLKSSLKKGISFTLHQDTPVVPPNILFSVHNAVTRITSGGKVLGAHQKIDIYEALRAVTINGAYQIFEDERKGTIETGKLADFVILDKNPLTCHADKIKDIHVVETIKNGKTIYKS